jgi:ABC-type glycerol-3-phosphate transport system substrate-binding protein
MMTRALRLTHTIFLIFLVGCSSLEPFLVPRTPTPARAQEATPTPPATATATAIPETEPPILRVWVPAQFDPSAGTAAADLLNRRLEQFEAENPGLQIEVRVKAEEGEQDLLNSLSITNDAAPASMPDLVALSRSDLEAAVSRGLLHPIDGLSTVLLDSDWHEYARGLGKIGETGYGLPFAGQTLVLVYRPGFRAIDKWNDLLENQAPVVFAADDPQGMIGLSLYASAGGEIMDAQGLPTLDPEVLTRLLDMIQEGLSRNVFLSSMGNISADSQTLQVYRSGEADRAIIWTLNYSPSLDGLLLPLPGLNETPYSFATGWVWALAGSNPEQQQLAVKLAEHLVADDYIAQWTRQTDYLPTRPSSLGEGDETIAAVLESAEPIPPNNVVMVLGPLMQEALTRVLKGEPADVVAGSVVEKLR